MSASRPAFAEADLQLNMPPQLSVVEGAPERDLHHERALHERVTFALMIVAVLMAAFLYIFMEARIGTAALEVQSLQDQIGEVQVLSSHVEIEIGALSSRARIEAYAMENLGMVYSDMQNIDYLSEDISRQVTAALAAEQAPAADVVVADIGRPGLWHSLAELIGGYFGDEAMAASE
ncbi:MAG: hypothetical protein IKC76_02420 [Firmicutes bacterium]|nr:hypothetical protein [Bacillota bacterium]MBR7113351.1 hypothetical protein [Bacillota bacterium]